MRLKRSISEAAEIILRRSSVKDGTDCLEWGGWTNSKGYGMIRVSDAAPVVHRVMYEAFVDQIPEGMHVLHKCDNRLCCNFGHLFVGTNKENIADKMRKDRSGKKLDIGKTKEIKRMLSDGHSQKYIADKFGVAQSIISRIKTGDRWSHVSNKEANHA